METLPQKLARTKEAVLQAGPRLALLYATTVLALVTLRIQSQGLTGKHYSPTLIPTFFFGKEALNAGGRAYIKKNKLGNWAGLRAAEGLQTAFVDLTHSGRMMRSLAVTGKGANGAVFLAAIVAADQESATKVERNLARYGNWLQPLPSEAAEAQAAVAAELQRITKQILEA
ncbi:hypothetical protein [Hymenobacter properus]|uniref:Uncharacterized protein n=1 Tax=Hymenobacter properus TaxID=2791026 RepID=A0A931BE54_9BACT|nr:hypothetical protein [Hymenobacter properus]MBF9140843.1 hypothetical protein [Hymenobacter properus]MBR7719652.1 hypothetical protein [Microvirga sp. SRT04]